MENQKELFYVPDLKPDKSYDSIGLFHQQSLSPPEEIVKKPEIERLIDVARNLSSLLAAIKCLPPETGFVLTQILEPLLNDVHFNVIENLPPDEKENDGDAEEDQPADDDADSDISVIKKKEDSFINDEIFFNNSNIDAVAEELKPVWAVLRDSHLADYLHMTEEYVSKLKQVLHAYFAHMATIAIHSAVPRDNYLLEDYDGNAVKIENFQLKHLSDSIIKSQIIRKQKTDFMRKTHNAENSLVFTRGLNSANSQRRRYHEEDYGTSKTFLDTAANQLLTKNRAESQYKYICALTNLYKYLNTSVALTDDILRMAVEEAEAKAQLLQNDVNVFAKTPAFATA